MSKFIRDDWMVDNGFLNEAIEAKKGIVQSWWTKKRVRDLQLRTPLTVLPNRSCKDAVQIMQDQGFDQLPVVNEKNEVLGMVTEGNLMSKIASGRIRADDSLSTVLYSQFKQVRRPPFRTY
jgi:cystathionine beta-synthase